MANELLAVGTAAPTLTLSNEDGNPISLADYQGKKVILFIYPKNNTGSCLKEALSLKEGYADLQAAGYEVLGLSPDTVKKHRNYIDKRELPFSLIADPEHQLIKAFGAWGEKSMYGKTYMGVMRSTFLIDEQGSISHVIPKVVTKDHANQILELLGAPA
ncbi:MAG: thioredoxin-dependent thiol peroxidase [Bacteroidota bacterium]